MLLLEPLAAFGLVLILWGMGRRLLGRWPLDSETWLERALLQIATGFIFGALVLFGLAAAQLYRPAILIGLYFGALLVVLWTEGRGMFAQLAGGLLSLSDERWTPFERACLPLIVLFLLLVGFYALAPTTTWDPLDYHYELPRLWLLHGGFCRIDTLVYANFPASTELMFGSLMAVASDLAANQFTIALVLLMVLAAVALGVRYCSRPAAVGGMVMLLGLPLIYTEQAQGGVIDCGLTFFILLALWAGLRWVETRAGRYLLMAGLLSGGAVGIKHSGWLIGFFLIGLVMVGSWRQQRKLDLVPALTLGAIAFACGLPWYVKSALFSGNPVWPFGASLLEGKPHGYADILYWSNPNFTRSPLNLLTWWWEVTTRTALTQYRFRLVTPTFLGLLPVAFALWNRPGPHRTLFIYAMLTISLLIFQAPGEPRYMLPAWAVLGMLLVHGAELAEWFKWRWSTFALATMILAPMAVTMGLLQIESRDRLPFVMGQDSRAESYARRVETWPAIQYVEAHLNPGELVLHGDPRVFLFADPSVYRIIYPFNYPGVPDWSQSAVRLLSQWHAMRVRFVTLSQGAHYMGLTRATLLEAQRGTNSLNGDQFGVRSAMDGTPLTLCRGRGGGWQHSEPLPETPLGPLSPRALELGGFTSCELTQLSNPRVMAPPPGEPNYLLDVRALNSRWKEPDVQIILRLNELIASGGLVKVLDNPACPVYEVHYPASWGPPGTELKREGAS